MLEIPALDAANVEAWERMLVLSIVDSKRLYARFPIGTTFPPLRGTRDTTAALARSSRAVAMYFA